MGLRQLEGMGDEISLLHMNCEGCEWEMLENLLKQPDVISKVPKIGTPFYKHRGAFLGGNSTALLQVRCLQVGTHYFPEVKL